MPNKSKQPTPATQVKKREAGELDNGKLDQVTGGLSLNYAKIEKTYTEQKS